MKPLRTINDFLNAYDEQRLLPEDIYDHTVRAISAAKLPQAAHCFIQLNEQAPYQAKRAIHLSSSLAGVTVHIKDILDIAGQVTTVGSQVLQGHAPATADAPVIARLKSAGAVILGRTNMSEFAYSCIGLNPHYGSPACAADSVLKRISGGSTSGGAVAIALNIGWASIGTDTGGSIRIPAALNGVVGWKPTAKRVPIQGCYPLSPTLDSIGLITRSVSDVLLIDDVMSSIPLQWQERTCKGMRFVVPEQLCLDGMDIQVASAFESALNALSKSGASIEMLTLSSLKHIETHPNLHQKGYITAYESWQFHYAQHQLYSYNFDTYDPNIAYRIQIGEHISPTEYHQLLQEKNNWAKQFATEIAPYDAVLLPTVPIVAPLIQDCIHDAKQYGTQANDKPVFFKINDLLSRNPSIFNRADGCAISLPCHVNGLPVGLMLGHSHLNDSRLLTAARAVEKVLNRLRHI